MNSFPSTMNPYTPSEGTSVAATLEGNTLTVTVTTEDQWVLDGGILLVGPNGAELRASEDFSPFIDVFGEADNWTEFGEDNGQEVEPHFVTVATVDGLVLVNVRCAGDMGLELDGTTFTREGDSWVLRGTLPVA